jgi:hypothetical protein
VCRLLGWGSKVQQSVQVTGDGVHIHIGLERNNPMRLDCGLPLGYADVQRNSNEELIQTYPHIRHEWSEVQETEWGDIAPSPLQWTAAEMVFRARRAQAAWCETLRRERKQRPAEALSEHDRSIAYKTAVKKHKKWVKETGGGVVGMPDFCRLSYFRSVFSPDIVIGSVMKAALRAQISS